MRVELCSTLLDGRHDPLLVLAIVQMGAAGRHRVLCDRERAKQWLEELPKDLREEFDNALDLSEQAEAAGPDVETVKVGAQPGDFASAPMRLTPGQAMNLLTRPLQVVVENGRNDRDFLLAFAAPATRKRLEDAEKEGWLEFWNGGGIGGCLGRAEQLEQPTASTFRTLVYSDSDAREPNQPSDKAKKVADALDKAERAHNRPRGFFGKVLDRRAAENYAPFDRLAAWWWAEKLGSAQQTQASKILKQREATQCKALALQDPIRFWVCAKVLAGTAEQVQAHYDVTQGRGRKGQRRTADTLWSTLSSWEQAALDGGLPKQRVREFFAQARDLHDASGELVEILQRICRNL